MHCVMANDRQIVARIPSDLAEAFALLARYNGHTFSEEVRTAMREHLLAAGRKAESEALTDEELDARLEGFDGLASD